MELFHTGFEEIREPDLRRGRRNADFGQGFYLSDSGEFAGKWAKERKNRQVTVNAYELDRPAAPVWNSAGMKPGMTTSLPTGPAQRIFTRKPM